MLILFRKLASAIGHIVSPGERQQVVARGVKARNVKQRSVREHLLIQISSCLTGKNSQEVLKCTVSTSRDQYAERLWRGRQSQIRECQTINAPELETFILSLARHRTRGN